MRVFVELHKAIVRREAAGIGTSVLGEGKCKSPIFDPIIILFFIIFDDCVIYLLS